MSASDAKHRIARDVYHTYQRDRANSPDRKVKLNGEERRVGSLTDAQVRKAAEQVTVANVHVELRKREER